MMDGIAPEIKIYVVIKKKKSIIISVGGGGWKRGKGQESKRRKKSIHFSPGCSRALSKIQHFLKQITCQVS